MIASASQMQRRLKETTGTTAQIAQRNVSAGISQPNVKRYVRTTRRRPFGWRRLLIVSCRQAHNQSILHPLKL
jgi:hypothetical protein